MILGSNLIFNSFHGGQRNPNISGNVSNDSYSIISFSALLPYSVLSEFQTLKGLANMVHCTTGRDWLP